MQFYSAAFIAFLIAALVVYYAVGKLAGKGQWIVLLVASLAFYAYSGIEHFIFIGTTALPPGVPAAHSRALQRA